MFRYMIQEIVIHEGWTGGPQEELEQRIARNEDVFRHILRDLVAHRKERPAGFIVPDYLNPEAPLEEILKQYSHIDVGRMAIQDFNRTHSGRYAFITLLFCLPQQTPGIWKAVQVVYDYKVKTKPKNSVAYVGCPYNSITGRR